MLDEALRGALEALLIFSDRDERRQVADYLHHKIYHWGNGKDECPCMVIARSEHAPRGCSDDCCQCWSAGYTSRMEQRGGY